ncbi:TetR/AcrR family transcriptional regulator [Kineococcus sp. NPDC059986]|uniref:TetR/AcrR family transcriptional regulator n=1 Tax=Kineococcus sp. NPDC059986 TaxID=3155538 RepID=UPI00344F6540
MAEGTGRPGAYRKGIARRQQILDHAIDLFAERGVDGASLRSVADGIGVSHAALRHYFSSRDELLVEAYREHERRHSSPEDPAAGGPVAQMARSADRNRVVPGLVQLYATLTADALQERHALTREFVQARFARVRAELAEAVAAGQREGRIDADLDPVDAAALVIAASDGLQVQWLLDPDGVDVRRSLELLERLLPSRSAPE